jgi:hypothetical protein
MGKLYFEINGGLGNQLFQIANAFAFAKKYETAVVFDTRGCDSGDNFHSSWHLQRLVDLLRLDINCETRRSNSYALIKKRQLHDLFFKKKYIEKSEIEETYKGGISKKLDYFFPVIENRFIAKEAMRFGFNNCVETLKNYLGRENLYGPKIPMTAGIHLRRSDRKNTELEIPDSWFLSQIRISQPEIDQIVCFTDSRNDAEFLKSTGVPVEIHGEELDPLIALLSLSEFDKIYISNSTFSFWASTLGKKKEVISPLEAGDPLRPLTS